jgi:hypothetical protein
MPEGSTALRSRLNFDGSLHAVIDPDDVETDRPWATASLRIASEELGVEAIGEQLGLRPTSSRTSEGEPAFAMWMLEAGLEPSAPLEDHLYILLEKVRDHRESLARLAQSATVEVWLSYSPGAVSPRPSVLTSSALAELGALGIDLVLDPYPPGGQRR